MLVARALYQRLKRSLTPAPAPFAATHASTTGRLLLRALGLPATRHNLDRLTLCAGLGLSLRTFIRDPDVFFPDPVLADEGFFLACFAAHCDRRHVVTRRRRRHDCAALLGLDAENHGPLVDAFLMGLVPLITVRLLTAQPGPVA